MDKLNAQSSPDNNKKSYSKIIIVEQPSFPSFRVPSSLSSEYESESNNSCW